MIDCDVDPTHDDNAVMKWGTRQPTLQTKCGDSSHPLRLRSGPGQNDKRKKMGAGMNFVENHLT